MMRWIRDFRLIPVVLIATICLFVLKTFGLVFDGGYLLGDWGSRNGDESDITGTITPTKDSDQVGAESSPLGASAEAVSNSDPKAAPKPAAKPAPKSWAHEMFNFPDVTGSIGETKDAKPPAAEGAKEAKDARPKAKPKEPPATAGWTPIAVDPHALPSSAERAILERLSERRTELEARSKELDMRENLLKAAEKRLEDRIAELKQLEARVDAAAQIKDASEAARFKNVVTMYENMKAKDAAKIFDRLDLKVLVDVSTKIKPRQMADILAQMSPDTAERLTVELASRKDKEASSELPKIEGHPTAQ